MTDQELINTLKTAAETVRDNLPLYMLLKMAAERLEEIAQ